MDYDDRSTLHEAELSIINYFVSICEKFKLRYFIMGGTLLGAVRHRGFIPWDDDVDMGMPRADYEKFRVIMIERGNNNQEFLYHHFTNSDIKTYFARLENPEIKIIDKSAQKRDVRNSWLDIFPLDGMPNNKIIRGIHELKLLGLRLGLQYSQFDKIVNVNLTERPALERFFIQIGKLIHPEKYLDLHYFLRKMDQNLKKYDFDSSKYVVNFMGAYKFKEMFPKYYYDDLVDYNFENIKLRASKYYDQILTKMYGEDYMKPPSKMIQNKHFSEVKND